MRWPALSLLGFAVTLVLFAGFVKGGDFVSGYLKVHGVRLPLDYVHGGVFGVWFLFSPSAVPTSSRRTGSTRSMRTCSCRR